MDGKGKIHLVPGFNSLKLESTLYKRLYDRYSDDLVLVDYDSHDPVNAFHSVSEALDEVNSVQESDVIVANSLGGFLALNAITNRSKKIVLINPSLQPWITLPKHDPESETVFIQYKEFDIYDYDADHDYSNFITLISSDNDEVIDSSIARNKLKPFLNNEVDVHDGHSLKNDESFNILFQEIYSLQNTINPAHYC